MPKFYSAVGCFVVTLPRLARSTQGVTQGGLSTFDLKLVDYVRSNLKVSTEILSELLSCTTRTIKRHLAKLPNVRYVGHGYSGHWEVDGE